MMMIFYIIVVNSGFGMLDSGQGMTYGIWNSFYEGIGVGGKAIQGRAM